MLYCKALLEETTLYNSAPRPPSRYQFNSEDQVSGPSCAHCITKYPDNLSKYKTVPDRNKNYNLILWLKLSTKYENDIHD